MKLRMNIGDILIGIFCYLVIDSILRAFIDGDYFRAITIYPMVGIFLAIAFPFRMKMEGIKVKYNLVRALKLVIAWMPIVWIQEVYDWAWK